jgi:hypothetical protein
MNSELTEKEKRFIKKLCKADEISRYAYIVAGFLGCISLLGVILGIKFHSKGGFLMAIYFGTMSLILLIRTDSNSKIVKIMKKLLHEKDVQ